MVTCYSSPTKTLPNHNLNILHYSKQLPLKVPLLICQLLSFNFEVTKYKFKAVGKSKMRDI